MPSPLHLDVLVAPYKPIVGLIPPMSAGEATWPATSVSLIAGERDAVLVDAALTPEDAEHIVKWIGATGKNLTTIYITHGHADHFFGLNTILGAFPAPEPSPRRRSSRKRRGSLARITCSSGPRCSRVRFPRTRSSLMPSTVT